MKTNLLNKEYYFLLVLIMFYACNDKEDSEVAINNTVCISVKDYLTGLPVQGASVTIYVEASDGSGTGLNGVSNSSGQACISYAGYIYLRGIETQAAGYERNCGPLILNPDITIAREIHLLKRTGFINFHLINQPPVLSTDSFLLTMYSDLDGCSGQNFIRIPPQASSDSNCFVSAVSGGNYIYWELYRNHLLVIDSTMSITVPDGDTAFVQINY